MPPPDHSFQDLERSRLIEKIWECVKDYLTTRKVTFRTVRACLWLSDIEMLREMFDNIGRNDGQNINMPALLEVVELRNIVKKCKQPRIRTGCTGKEILTSHVLQGCNEIDIPIRKRLLLHRRQPVPPKTREETLEKMTKPNLFHPSPPVWLALALLLHLVLLHRLR